MKDKHIGMKNGFCIIGNKAGFSGWLVNLFVGLFLATGVLALVGCAQKTSVFGGKKLVLEIPDSPMSFEFPQGDEYCLTRGENTEHPFRSYHCYDAAKQEFYEESKILNVHDGCGSSLWHLNFTTPTTGKATLIRKHPWSFRTKNIGYTVPFRVAPLSAASVEISIYPYGETKRLTGEAAEALLRELRTLYDSSTERKLNRDVAPTLTAEGAISGHAQDNSPLLDIEDGEQSWYIARGLNEDEALLISHDFNPCRVPNQQKMRLLLKNLGMKY